MQREKICLVAYSGFKFGLGTYFKKSILTLLQDCPDDSNCEWHLESH
jgi:hypothetical protein